ncbi:MAG: hypothetical protein WD139_08995 [Balneolaceae bacterium]
MIIKPENNFSNHIRQVLHEYEEPYEAGAWERFQQKQDGLRNRKIILRVAASLLVVLTFAFAWTNSELPEPVVLITEDVLILQPDNNIYEPLTEAENQPAPKPLAVREYAGGASDQKYEIRTVQLSAITSGGERVSVSKHAVPRYSIADKMVELIQTPAADEFNENGKSLQVIRPAPYNRYAGVGDIRITSDNVKRGIEFSIAYASVINIHDSQTDMGFGGGVYTDWHFAENLSAGSGLFVSSNQLKYAGESGNSLMKETDEPETLASDDNLAYMQLDLVNLEIPLSLRYHISNNISLSAGVTSVAFLKEEYDYTFEYDQPIQVFQDDESGIGPMTRMVTMTTSQKESEPSFSKIELAALYTFALGYQQQIRSRYQIMFEPFLKIPAGHLTSRNIRYTTGGIQLKITF